MKDVKAFDFLVFIGRFQPFHRGHLAVIQEGLKQSEHLIVLVGSAHQPRNFRNPWTVSERENMIRSALSDTESQRVHIVPLMDVMYNDESWVRNVQATVNGLVTAHHGQPHRPAKVGLIGHSKDHTAYYLNLFPQWGAVQVDNYRQINATAIRNGLFQTQREEEFFQSADDLLPAAVVQELRNFVAAPLYQEIRDEHVFVNNYKSAWNNAPYPPTFVTVDAVVVQSGHVLLVERKARPGKGQLALPGGFVNQTETLVAACLRELKEETRLKIPTPVLKGHIKTQKVFDDPNRSTRGRTFTHAFYIELEPNKDLPKVKGGDDSKHAMWIPLADLDPGRMYEDHYFIIQELTGV
ncbi:MAG: bifunctional nicotinamide-nucleotide adenylyltransferase/Nudix hydroxylase [Gammaproteobacteria bacterium]|nr:bifunctional nicotinamide-nucleotide adenylyltransferase/Nudix hydroxylase [Gammaproteobacteria bacterium]MDH5802564.1 bifunctional nicotinamide-nucleotide adenylyltransferase/Nudix hydroxylase [Gammaproteobacteria bacterium]